MQIQLTGNKIEVTPALREFTHNKFIRSLNRFENKIGTVHVTLSVEKAAQIAKAKLNWDGTEIFAHSESTDMYAAIDLLLDKLVTELTKHKEKHNNHR